MSTRTLLCPNLTQAGEYTPKKGYFYQPGGTGNQDGGVDFRQLFIP